MIWCDLCVAFVEISGSKKSPMQDLEDDLTSSPVWDSQEIPRVVDFIAFGEGRMNC